MEPIVITGIIFLTYAIGMTAFVFYTNKKDDKEN